MIFNQLVSISFNLPVSYLTSCIMVMLQRSCTNYEISPAVMIVRFEHIKKPARVSLVQCYLIHDLFAVKRARSTACTASNLKPV